MTNPGAEDDSEYANLLELDDLETLLEELEESGVRDDLSFDQLPDETAAQARSLGVQSLGQLRERIVTLHARLDREEFS